MEFRYISPDLAESLEKAGLTIDEGGEVRKITVMFVDMRGFTHILTRHDAKKVLHILDIYFRMLVVIIRKYGGIVDKYMGDGLMALWGFPHEKAFDTYNAIRAAIEIRIGMFRLIPELVRISEIPLEVGIGIGTGTVVAGFVGPPSRRDFTLVGNCINRAARLQELASDNRIFIDALTAAEVKSYSYMIHVPKVNSSQRLFNENVYELEGIYEYSKEFESARRYPRVIVAKVVGITKLADKQRKAALVKSIGEGGLGVELHDYDNFALNVGDEALFDSRNLSLLGSGEARGTVIRKKELKEDGIFRLKTWDVGVRFTHLSEEVKKKLLKIFVGSRRVKEFSTL